jgi:acetyl esterase/lipase
VSRLARAQHPRNPFAKRGSTGRNRFLHAWPLLALVLVAVPVLYHWRAIYLGVLQAVAPYHPGERPWEEIIAQPGSLDLAVRGHGVRRIEFEPSCSNRPGTDPRFSFFFRRGTVNKLLVLFSGGGACWSGQNCIPGDGSSGLRLDGRVSYVDEIFPQMFGLLQFTARGRYGMLDHLDPENPIRDWHAVWIFSCDGSVFWGSRDHEYTDPFYGGGTHTLRHRGFDNAMAVLAYLRRRVPDPDQILVSGQSAGGYGSAMLFPYFRESFPRARADLLVDSAAGIVPRRSRGDTYDFLSLAIPIWGAHENAPEWVGLPRDEEALAALDLEDIMAVNARFYPESRVAEYPPAWDLGQVYIWHLMKHFQERDVDWRASIYAERRYELIPDETVCEWNERLRRRRRELIERAAREGFVYSLFLAPGDHHGLGQGFDGTSSGTPFRAWLRELVEGERPPATVICEDCGQPAEVACPKG